MAMRIDATIPLVLLTAFLCSGSGVADDRCADAATWTGRMICGSEELSALDRRISLQETALADAADARFRPLLADDAARWRKTRPQCRAVEYPQQCLERLHYARLDELEHIANLVIGPRRFGRIMPACWRMAETDDEAEDCLERKLAASASALAVVAGAVRKEMASLDGTPDAARDAVRHFDEAEAAFASYVRTSCDSQAAAFGSGRGTACRIRMTRRRAVDILKFLPRLAPHWSSRIASHSKAIAACADRTAATAVLAVMPADAASLRIRLRDAAGKTTDCTAGKTSATVAALSSVAAGDVVPGEGLAIYYVGAARPRSDLCSIIEPVVTGRTGSVAGWLAFGRC